MARKKRIEKIGFYHIVNRGVARNTIYSCDDDFLKFLEIVQDASEEYGFEIFSYCLMDNHYHLLLKTTDMNLSILMQKINSRYSIYFNHKYKRVGPLWQGRFKSWYVYDENYLHTLVKYIETNPVKANMALVIGQYKWSMSSKYSAQFSMLKGELIDSIDFHEEFNEKDQKQLHEFLNQKLSMQEYNSVTLKKKTSLEEHFHLNRKEEAILQAVRDGYTQSSIASFLNLSNVSISKILKIYKQKLKLFVKLKEKGIFWSYSKEMDYNENLLIEHTLKYADFDDIVLLLKLFGKRKVKSIWEKTMKSDTRFIKLNLMIARVFFGMDVESDYFKKVKNERFEKLKLLAS